MNNPLLIIPRLAFGGNVLGWTVDEKRGFEILDALTQEEFNFIDTADYYSRWAGKGGESETILGKWMKERKNRQRIIVATKVGMDMGEGASLSGKYIRKAVDNSLKRLQTDYIDLYQSHRDDLNTPVGETLSTYADLIKEGKVLHIGASNFSLTRLQESVQFSKTNGIPEYKTLQPLYNLCERSDFEGTMQRFCVENKIKVIPYFALASGFLTGKYRKPDDRSKSIRGDGASKYMTQKGFRILAALDTVASKHGVKPGAIAVAWLLAQPAVAAPIASASSVEQLKEIVAGTKLQLSDEELNLLQEASR